MTDLVDTEANPHDDTIRLLQDLGTGLRRATRALVDARNACNDLEAMDHPSIGETGSALEVLLRECHRCAVWVDDEVIRSQAEAADALAYEDEG